MTTTRLVIEERRQGHPDLEEALLIAHATTLGLPVERLTWKPFVQGRFVPQKGDVVAGSVTFVRSALKALGKPLPPQNPYPESLRGFLHRRVWQSPTLGNVLNGWTEPVFIRPAKRWKLFTGFVAQNPRPAEVYGISRREPVWCAEVVRFVSEWRCYVVDHTVLFIGLAKFGGDRTKAPDPLVLEVAAALYAGPAAYAMDFGVLDSGETALIEVNDGFSVGAYDGVPAETYWQMIATRWHELTASPTPTP